MLTYLARLLPVALRAKLADERQLVSRLQRRVALRDVDTNLHMNQAAYALVGELGRADWVMRSGAWGRWKAQGVGPVVAEQHIIYRRELKPLVRFVMDTRALRLDGRLLCLETYLVVADRVHAKLEVKLLFVDKQGVLSAERTGAICQEFLTSPLAVEAWTVTASPD